MYRCFTSPLTIALSYILGGLVPILPYLYLKNVDEALLLSSVVTLIALFGFGYLKAKVMGMVSPILSAFFYLMIGGLSAGAAYLISRLMVLK